MIKLKILVLFNLKFKKDILKLKRILNYNAFKQISEKTYIGNLDNNEIRVLKEKISKILNKKVVAGSWQVLYDKYVTEDLYFKDKISKYIFFLVELEGKPQLEFLGITYDYYRDRKIAEKWHKEMVKLIHPDRCKHPKATEAMQALEKLYKGMI